MSTTVPAPASVVLTENKHTKHKDETKHTDLNMITAGVITFFSVLTILTLIYNAMYRKDGDTLCHSLLMIAVSLYLIQSVFVNYIFLDISNLVYFILRTPYAQKQLSTIGIKVEPFQSR